MEEEQKTESKEDTILTLANLQLRNLNEDVFINN